MRVRFNDTMTKLPESDEIYIGSKDGFVRRKKGSWEAEFARFERLEEKTDNEESTSGQQEAHSVR